MPIILEGGSLFFLEECQYLILSEKLIVGVGRVLKLVSVQYSLFLLSRNTEKKVKWIFAFKFQNSICSGLCDIFTWMFIKNLKP